MKFPRPSTFGLRLALTLYLSVASVFGFRDDFDDGNDEGWRHLDPLGEAGLSDASVPTVEDGVYRLRALAPKADAGGPGRVFALAGDEEYTDFYCAVDVVDWNDEINQAWGILGRSGNFGLGQTTGYVCNYDPNQTGSRPGGQFQINKVTGEASEKTIAAADIKLIAGRSYRLVFVGEGNRLTGMLFDLEDLTSPVVKIETDGDQDPLAIDYPEGAFGLFDFYRGDDVLEAHAVPDCTFDNFIVEAANLHRELLPGVAHGVEGIAQVTDRVPMSNANFYPAHEGIQFTLTTLTAASPDAAAVKLSLNGEDVSDQLEFAAGEELVVSFHGLESNQVYDAVIELGENGATNRFSFDTYDPLFFSSGEVVVIEAEDYNFNGGQFQDNPAPSGVSLTGATVNGGGTGYFDLPGVLDVDFSDVDSGPQTLNDYRDQDSVALRPGSDQVNPGPLVQDTVRAKYADTGAQDYQVHRTEAGEWLNYTRTIPAGDYQIFLRTASRASQSVRLDRVTNDATGPNQTLEALGAFAVPNLVTPQTFRLIPLTDPDGTPTVSAFDGETTLRLTMDAPEADFSSKYVLYLNYLVLVPVSRDEPNLSVSLGGIFGDLGEEATDTTVGIPLRNSAAMEILTITGTTLQGEDMSHYQIVSAPETLAPGETGELVVTFARQGREGVFLGELVIASNDQTSPEIVVDLTATVPLASGLLVHYAMDESEGDMAEDASGMRRHGRYRTTEGSSVQLGESGVASGSAVRLTESGNGAAFIEIPRNAGIPSLNAFTASVWVMTSGEDVQGTLLSKGTLAADPFAVALAGPVVAWGAAAEQVFQTEGVVPLDVPAHLVLTYAQSGENADVGVFVNGVEVARDDAGPAFNDGAPSIIQIGALNGGLGWSGVIDDFQLYGRVLSADEISSLHASPGQSVEGSDGESPAPTSFAIQEITRAGDNIQIAFTSEPNIAYVVQASGDLTPGSWTAISTVTGAEQPATVTKVSIAVEGSARFVRVGEP